MAKVLNRDRLRAKLRALSPDIKKHIQPAMEKGAGDIVAMARNLVPVGRSRALLNSIDWSWGAAPRGSISVSSGLIAGGLADLKSNLLITVYAGNEVAYYARWVEFGTQAATFGGRVADRRTNRPGATRKSYRTHPGTPAQPFFYPSYRAYRRSVSNRITRAVRSAILRVANGGH